MSEEEAGKAKPKPKSATKSTPRKKEQHPIVEAFDIIVDATAKYLRAIFPPIFTLSKKEK